MQQAIKIFFSPMAFAVGFLWPLVTQILFAAAVVPEGWQGWLAGALIALPLGLMAQWRGSWLWIR